MNRHYYRDTDYEKRMAKSDVQKCMDWLFQQQGDMEIAGYGKGQSGVLEAVKKQRLKDREIKDFRNNINRALEKSEAKNGELPQIDGNYESVQALSSKRTACLEIISQIASLEEIVQDMSTELDSRAVHLVNIGENNKLKGASSQTNESLARAAQTCITAVRQNWKWIITTMQCAELHGRNAAAYQEFFHEVEEAEYWMNTTLSKIHTTFDKSKLNGDRADVQAIMDEMKDVLLAYLQWQSKVDSLFERSKDLVPVPLRLNKLPEPRPVIALTDYNTKEISFSEGDSLTLIDNSDRKSWKVRNSGGQIGNVPAVILLLPGPSGPAVDAAVKLRLQLLALWTNSVKRLGYQMIAFMLLVFRDWNSEEISALQAMSKKDKLELLRILKYLEDTLIKNWDGYGDFEQLQERILRLRTIIEEAPEADKSDPSTISTVVVQIQYLEQLLNKYQDFWAYWETNRTVVELLRQPKYLLVCDKWEQLRYVTTAHFVTFWDTNLGLEDYSKPQKVTQPLEKQQSSLTLHEKPKEHMTPTMEVEEEEWTMSTEYEETITDQVQTSVEEEQHTFVITGVVDPRTDERLSLQQAIMMNIVDQAKGTYTNPLTRKTIPMSQAMNEGLIVMDFISKTKIREEKKEFGLITVKVTRENRPYTILSVVDPATEQNLTVAQAVEKKILNTRESTYKTEHGEKMSVADAISSGLVRVEYHKADANHPPTVESKTYAVNAVVDQKQHRKIPFAEAINSGILNRNTGEYTNNITNEKVHVTEAIVRGFIKARVVNDANALDIDPENKIVVEKLDHVKSKLSAIRAFKNGV
ncbi:dystonin isoform X2 [Patella vulgata]|uniref:dystonin isoform X2 n=1 Tax=Patella vulgata TaxID=6465 RepID=UPI0024A8ED24|nr:dystonin isoform X2 [Patella vulgata]